MSKVNLEGIDFKTINNFKYITIPIEDCKYLNIGYSPSLHEENEVICSQCNDICIKQTHYVGALNDVLCDNCLETVLPRLTYYKENEYYEDRHIQLMGNNFNKFNIQSMSNAFNILKEL